MSDPNLDDVRKLLAFVVILVVVLYGGAYLVFDVLLGVEFENNCQPTGLGFCLTR